MKKLQNLGRSLSKEEQKKIRGGDEQLPSCEDGCILDGGPTGCPEGKTCKNVTCNQDPNQCHNICILL